MTDNSRLNRISTIRSIYRKILGRDADQSGISTYLDMIVKPNGIQELETILYSSEEYKKRSIKSNEFNSLTGDRSAYIKVKDTSLIDNSRYGKSLTSILKLIVLLENPHYPNHRLLDRVNSIKQSLIHIGNNRLNFTIFPHIEQNFNSDKINNYLTDNNHFQYFVLFLGALNIWKKIFNRVVDTCGTTEIVQFLHKEINSLSDFDIKYLSFIIDYFSVRYLGTTISETDKKTLLANIKNQEYQNIIPWFQNKKQQIEQSEETTIKKNINNLTLKLGRKPKVLLMIAYLETQNPKLIEHMLHNANMVKKTNSMLDIDFAFDTERVNKESTDYTPWSRVKRIRNLMIEKYPIHEYDYLYIIDSDIIDYPYGFLSRAIGLNPEGITAPLAIIQYSDVFYDWCGYQKLNATSINSEYGEYILEKAYTKRNFNLKPPYISDQSRLCRLDCVGCTYVVPTQVFKQTYGEFKQELLEVFKLANVKNHKINDNIIQYEDHPSFTDHYTICTAIRANGGNILLDRGSTAYHADLPLYGENWH